MDTNMSAEKVMELLTEAYENMGYAVSEAQRIAYSILYGD